MKKISIFALVLILTASMTGCWRRRPAETTVPSTSAPATHSTVPTTTATVPSTAGTMPTPAPTDAILPDMEGTIPGTEGTGSDTTDHPAETNANSRSMTKY